jgi:hypothetical protein
MRAVCRAGGAVHAVEQKAAIAGIDQRVHAFRQHCRTAGEEGGAELGQRDGEIAGECGVDDFL